jgi:hypothetical protein
MACEVADIKGSNFDGASEEVKQPVQKECCTGRPGTLMFEFMYCKYSPKRRNLKNCRPEPEIIDRMRV